MNRLFERLYEHALRWQRIGNDHPAFRDPALIDDLKKAAEALRRQHEVTNYSNDNS